MSDRDYQTVGQLARKVGTTVRTIQYYDQQGLLSPSAKGPGNQRLYSPEDEKELYRILTLKYLGLSLSDIKEQKDSVSSAAALHELLSQTMESLEEDFQNLVKRLSVLRTLVDQTAQTSVIDWENIAHIVEEGQPDSDFFWHRVEDGSMGPAGMPAVEQGGRGMAVAKWHELVADAIALLSDHASPDEPRSQALAVRYVELERAQTGTLSDMFNLAENVTPHHGASGSFEVLRDSVFQFLEDAKHAGGLDDVG